MADIDALEMQIAAQEGLPYQQAAGFIGDVQSNVLGVTQAQQERAQKQQYDALMKRGYEGLKSFYQDHNIPIDPIVFSNSQDGLINGYQIGLDEINRKSQKGEEDLKGKTIYSIYDALKKKKSVMVPDEEGKADIGKVKSVFEYNNAIEAAMSIQDPTTREKALSYAIDSKTIEPIWKAARPSDSMEGTFKLEDYNFNSRIFEEKFKEAPADLSTFDKEQYAITATLSQMKNDYVEKTGKEPTQAELKYMRDNTSLKDPRDVSPEQGAKIDIQNLDKLYKESKTVSKILNQFGELNSLIDLSDDTNHHGFESLSTVLGATGVSILNYIRGEVPSDKQAEADAYMRENKYNPTVQVMSILADMINTITASDVKGVASDQDLIRIREALGATKGITAFELKRTLRRILTRFNIEMGNEKTKFSNMDRQANRAATKTIWEKYSSDPNSLLPENFTLDFLSKKYPIQNEKFNTLKKQFKTTQPQAIKQKVIDKKKIPTKSRLDF